MVTGVDAIINYDPDVLEVGEIENGEVFSSLSRQDNNQEIGKIEISGSFSKVKDDAGNPLGYNGSGDAVAIIHFKAKEIGETRLSFSYNGGQDTSDSNIIAFKRGEAVDGQMPIERFLQKPSVLTVNVKEKIAVATPSPTPSSTPDVNLSGKCGPCDAIAGPNGVKLRGCQPGLVCQNQQPKCFIDPKSGKERCQMIAGGVGVCVPEGQDATFCKPQSSPKPSYTPKPTSTPTPSPLPKAELGLRLTFLDRVANPRYVRPSDLGGNVANPKIMPNFSASGVLYGATESYVGTDTIGSKTRRVYGDLVKLADFTTDPTGRATVIIPQKYEGKRMKLFVRTASHLMKASSGNPVSLPSSKSGWRPFIAKAPTTVNFLNLVPGDLHIAEGKSEQDNVINTFDALVLIKNLGSKSYLQADLNADRVVNTRDLKILFNHLGERGDDVGQNNTPPINPPLPQASCKTNADCQAGYYCYQPPMPKSKDGRVQLQMMPVPYCKKAGGVIIDDHTVRKWEVEGTTKTLK